MCEGTGRATRLRKSGKQREDLRRMCEGTTRLRESGKKKIREGTCEGTGMVD